jgi:hypothetical protein
LIRLASRRSGDADGAAACTVLSIRSCLARLLRLDRISFQYAAACSSTSLRHEDLDTSRAVVGNSLRFATSVCNVSRALAITTLDDVLARTGRLRARAEALLPCCSAASGLVDKPLPSHALKKTIFKRPIAPVTSRGLLTWPVTNLPSTARLADGKGRQRSPAPASRFLRQSQRSTSTVAVIHSSEEHSADPRHNLLDSAVAARNFLAVMQRKASSSPRPQPRLRRAPRPAISAHRRVF